MMMDFDLTMREAFLSISGSTQRTITFSERNKLCDDVFSGTRDEG